MRLLNKKAHDQGRGALQGMETQGNAIKYALRRCIVSWDICDIMWSGNVYRNAYVFGITFGGIAKISGIAEWSAVTRRIRGHFQPSGHSSSGEMLQAIHG